MFVLFIASRMRRQEQSRISSKDDRIELGETSSSWYVENRTQGVVRRTRRSSMLSFSQPFHDCLLPLGFVRSVRLEVDLCQQNVGVEIVWAFLHDPYEHRLRFGVISRLNSQCGIFSDCVGLIRPEL